MEETGSNSMCKKVVTMLLLLCISMGYYSEILQESLCETIELTEAFEMEDEKEEKETEKDIEIDKLFSELIDKCNFQYSNKVLRKHISGRNLPSHYLDNFTPPPEKA